MLTLLEKAPKEQIPLALELLSQGKKLLQLHVNVSIIPDSIQSTIFLKKNNAPGENLLFNKKTEIEIESAAEFYEEVHIHLFQQEQNLKVLSQSLVENCPRNITIILHGKIEEKDVSEIMTVLAPLNPAKNLSIKLVRITINSNLLDQINQFNFSPCRAIFEEVYKMGFGLPLVLLNIVMEYLIQTCLDEKTIKQNKRTYQEIIQFFSNESSPKSQQASTMEL